MQRHFAACVSTATALALLACADAPPTTAPGARQASADRVVASGTTSDPPELIGVSAGGAHSCATDDAGGAWCWGNNVSGPGQLGDGTTITRLLPVAVAGAIEFARVSAGEVHSCGLDRSGVAYCWGAGQFGFLGNGEPGFRLVPTPVAGGLAFASISAGAIHSCALTTDGHAYCWGWNASGRLGIGPEPEIQSTPAAVVGGLLFTAVEAGGTHSCALTTAGKAYCWGHGANGQLGNGDVANSAVPVAVSGARTFASISVGGFHSCAIHLHGRAYCWGNGEVGQLGYGSTPVTRSTPAIVSGDRKFAVISAGEFHTCALTTAGRAYCWGLGLDGRLGNGSTSNRKTPVAVAGGLTFATIDAGISHTCAVTTGGQAYCWGRGALGRLGDGTEQSWTRPRRVDFGT